MSEVANDDFGDAIHKDELKLNLAKSLVEKYANGTDTEQTDIEFNNIIDEYEQILPEREFYKFISTLLLPLVEEYKIPLNINDTNDMPFDSFENL